MTRLSTILIRTVRRVAATLADIDYAQRRLDSIRMNPDSYLTHADTGPQNYREFLFRTSGPLLHEPPAARRVRGQLTR
jgi:hypothetical protein